MSIQYPHKLQVRSPADLLALVPYLLGFHPQASVVAIAMADRRVAFAARADLPTPDTAHAEIRPMLDHLAAVATRQQATTVVLIGYGDAGQVDPVLADAADVFAAHGVRLHDALRVTDDRYFSYLCQDPTCCPPQGTRFDPTSSVLAAYATVAGHVALPDRAALAARLAPVDGPARHGMQQATDRAVIRLRRLIAAAADRPAGQVQTPSPGRADLSDASSPAARVYADADALVRHAGQVAIIDAFDRTAHGERLGDDEAAWLTLLLVHIPVRDQAWQRTRDRDAHVQLWTDLTRRAHQDLVAAPASLLAFAAWRSGDGALANLAIDRALAADPTYRMALLLSEALRHGMPPTAFDDMPAVADDTPTHQPDTRT
jgi:hypothetical protein